MKKFLFSAIFAALVVAVWWCIITFIAFAITKSGGTGEWVNDLKPYVLAGMSFFIFIASWFSYPSTSNTSRTRRYR